MALKIAVLGAGNGGYACSADLSLAGYQVNLFELPKFKTSIKPIMQTGCIEITGAARTGVAKLNKVTTNIEDAIKGVNLILIVVPAFAHKTFIETCIPYIENGQTIVFMGKGGGALEFAKALKDQGIKKEITIGETCTLPYTARITGQAQVKVFATVKKLPTAAFPAKDTDKLIRIMKEIYPVVPATNVLETLLLDLNTVVHPAPVILNAARIELKEEFLLYAEGVTPAIARVVEAVDRERLAVMEALGLKPIPFPELVYMIGLAAGKCRTILEDFTSSQGIIGARELKAPSTLTARHITEDVPYGLVPLASIAEMIGVTTPVIRSLITIASVLNQVDYWKVGRTTDKLGISGLKVEELKKYLTTGEV
jgi:opine dehydrogenase